MPLQTHAFMCDCQNKLLPKQNFSVWKISTCKFSNTRARVTINGVITRGTVLTRVRLTLVNVRLAVRALREHNAGHTRTVHVQVVK